MSISTFNIYEITICLQYFHIVVVGGANEVDKLLAVLNIADKFTKRVRFKFNERKSKVCVTVKRCYIDIDFEYVTNVKQYFIMMCRSHVA